MSKSSENLKASVAARLKQARSGLEMTQKELSDSIGKPISSLRDYEGGISIPGGEVLAAYANAGVNTTWLLTGVGNMWADGIPRASRSHAAAPVPPVAWPSADNQVKPGTVIVSQSTEKSEALWVTDMPDRTQASAPVINEDAMVAAFVGMSQVAKPGETAEQTARKAVKFYIYLMQQELITSSGIGRGKMGNVA